MVARYKNMEFDYMLDKQADQASASTDFDFVPVEVRNRNWMRKITEVISGAGIAHEIQNPLNFVNNFSEVSVELIDELKEEVQAGRTDDALSIANDLTQNLHKITHYGKRASNIIKGMLDHSRTGSGEKQPIHLNALADEYLRLT